jgi:hypothetical protein
MLPLCIGTLLLPPCLLLYSHLLLPSHFALYCYIRTCCLWTFAPCCYLCACCPYTFVPCCYLHTCYYLCALNLVVAFMLIVGFVHAALMPSHLLIAFMPCALPFHFQIPTPPPSPLPFCYFIPLLFSHLVFCVLVGTPSQISCVGGGAWSLV